MNLKIKIISIITILSLVATVFVVPIFPESVSANSEQSANLLFYYTAQLKSSDAMKLQAIGTNVSKLFTFSNSPELSNTYSFQSPLPLEQVKSKLADNFVYVEYDPTFQTTAKLRMPNDPGFTKNSSNIDKQWGLVKAEFIESWKITKGSKAVTVAVIDTGIDSLHEDLIDSTFVNGYNVIKSKKISAYSNSDDNGHGTLVAGVIGATTNNNTGVSGAAWEVSLMAVKALNSRGSGTASQISEGIVWATNNGANIINMSLGGIGFVHNNTLANAITHAFENNVVIVSAAGNDVAITGGNLDVEPVFPICNDNGQNMVIGVSASDTRDLKPDFANFGKACVDVVAPGKRILSTINHDPATGLPSPDSYAYASGTSLAVPFVSAQAALLKSVFPNANNRQIRDRIIASADPVDRLNLSQCANRSCKGLLGSGRINVAKSLEEDIDVLQDGDVVRIAGTNDWYYINGGKKQFISTFVRNQRFLNTVPTEVQKSELISFSEGSYAEPLDGTLIQSPNSPTVYYMSKGVRLPITASVFKARKFQYKDIYNLSSAEVESWVLGSFLTPPNGSLIRTTTNPTIYWVLDEIIHPINYQFYLERGLNAFPVVYMPESDIKGFPTGDPFIR